MVIEVMGEKDVLGQRSTCSGFEPGTSKVGNLNLKSYLLRQNEFGKLKS